MSIKFKKRHQPQRLVFLIGLPATGKSTVAKFLNLKKSYEIISADKIISEISKQHSLSVSDTISLHAQEIDAEIQKQVLVVKATCRNAIIDLPNLTVSSRERILNRIIDKRFRWKTDKIAIYFDCPIQGIMDRNKIRELDKENHDPEELQKMATILEEPQTNEFDYIMKIEDHLMKDYQRDYLTTLQYT